jgi:hypothetical protein
MFRVNVKLADPFETFGQFPAQIKLLVPDWKLSFNKVAACVLLMYRDINSINSFFISLPEFILQL